MSNFVKTVSKDETRLGEHAATQPLSGTNIVTMVRVKSFNSTNFATIVVEATKKAV